MSTLADPATSWAVLVGVPHYRALADLPAVSENVASLRRLLADPPRWGLPAAQCLTPDIDQAAHPLDAVMEDLLVAADRATDTLLFYYAGHGLSDPLSGELYLALPGAESLRYAFRALAFDVVRRVLSAPGLRATRRVVILDCCYSALALDGEMGGPAAGGQLADLTTVSGAYVFTACAETEAALAPPGEPYTAFTGALVGALEDGVPGGPELLDLHTLYRHLVGVLDGQHRPVPQQRSRNLVGDVAFARNVAWDGSGPAPARKRPGPSPAMPHAEQVRLRRRSGDFAGAAEILSAGADATDPEALRRHIRMLRRAQRHAEAAELLRRISDG